MFTTASQPRGSTTPIPNSNAFSVDPSISDMDVPFGGTSLPEEAVKQRDKMALHRPRLNRKSNPEDKNKSRLITNFDPMKDRHMWAMWRTAVNGRIIEQVRRNEELMASDDANGVGEVDSIVYGKDLTSVPPLSRFIRLNQKSKEIAQELMNEGEGKLETNQFIYYGIPRVTITNNKYSHSFGSDEANYTDYNYDIGDGHQPHLA